MAEALKAIDGNADISPAPVRHRLINLRTLAMALLLLGAVILGVYWLYDRLTHVVVLDAKVAGSMIMMSSRVPGRVVNVPVNEGEMVEAGRALIEIDNRDAQLKVRELEAALQVLEAEAGAMEARISLTDSSTGNHVSAVRSDLDAARSDLAAAQSQYRMAKSDWERADSLKQRNLVSQQQWDESRNTLVKAEQDLRSERAGVTTAEAELAEAVSATAEVKVLSADLFRIGRQMEQTKRALERAVVNLEEHTLRASAPGILDELFIDPGEYVNPGQRVLIMHDENNLWIRANVKETDIRHLEVGKPVDIIIDAFPDDSFEGAVSRVGSAATNQFALLPNPNPSGNFTKITQRVEVSFRLDEADTRLKPGMMAQVKFAKAQATPP